MRHSLIAKLLAVVITFFPFGGIVHAQGQFAMPKAALPKHKVVFQVSDNDPKKWELVMSNIRNIQADLGKENIAVELVAYGPGLAMLQLESPASNRVADALRAGVKVVACENTMHGQKLTKDDMLSGISYVPAGVSEIMLLQEAGYTYVRP